MKLVIAEDEQHTRAELKYLLEKLEPDALILEASNGAEALDLVLHETPDVVFLDINMPAKSGLAVAKQLLEQHSSTLIVFATAFDEHAIKAFDLAAVDYLVKPYRERRLAETLKRIRAALGQKEQALEWQSSTQNYVLENALPSVKKLWAAKGDGVGVLLKFEHILWFESDDKKVLVQTQLGERYLVRYTMSDLEQKLLVDGFFRSHKSYVINLEHVREIEPWFSGTFVIRMSNNETVPLSRQYAKLLKEKLGWF